MTTLPAVAEDAKTWTAEGSALVLQVLAGLDDRALDAPSALPDWSRRHVLAHVAANAEALGRLLAWARSGVEQRMYSSPEQRAADIAAGALLPADRLRAWVAQGVRDLALAMAQLPGQAWSEQVVTAQGRTVAASQVPWMRAREVCVHSVDLRTGLTFADLPSGFCAALVGDVSAWLSAAGHGPALTLLAADGPGCWPVAGTGVAQRVALPVADLAGWLTGRTVRPDLPAVPAWL